jgi:fluoride ion exporter CrcB/FEX
MSCPVLGLLPTHHRLVRPSLCVGILGFTTFSAYAVLSGELVRVGHPVVVMFNLGGTALSALLMIADRRRVGAPARYLTDRAVQSHHEHVVGLIVTVP